MRKSFRCLSYALVGIALMLVTAQTALAHRDPTGSSSTGVSIALTAFRSDQITPIGGGAINECETIYYQATLAPAAGAAAIEGGTLVIQTPDLAFHDVTPGAPEGNPGTGIPCLGGTINDTNSLTVGQCAGSDPNLVSAMVLYQSSFAAGTCTATSILTANVIYSGGRAHNGVTDQLGVGAQTPFQSPVVCCTDDGPVCNGVVSCDPTVLADGHLGSCVESPDVNCADDGNVCNGPEVCSEPSGLCVSGPDAGDSFTCPDIDGNLCTTAGCDGLGSCDQNHVVTTCADDGNVCNGPETCDTTTGGCVSGPNEPDSTVCTDTDGVCPTAGCVAGVCSQDHVPCPSDEICRTPGFWGTHGGIEKGGPNITQAVLNETGPLSICGGTISSTIDLTWTSALQAICVSPKGDSTLQLARQLTAAALNCGLTNSAGCGGLGQTAGNVCNNVSIEDVFNACNEACAAGLTSPASGDFAGISCIDAIDCFNNGGTGLDGDICTGNSGCHDRPVVNGCLDFPNTGPASSPRACNDARKDDCTITCDVFCSNTVACP